MNLTRLFLLWTIIRCEISDENIVKISAHISNAIKVIDKTTMYSNHYKLAFGVLDHIRFYEDQHFDTTTLNKANECKSLLIKEFCEFLRSLEYLNGLKNKKIKEFIEDFVLNFKDKHDKLSVLIGISEKIMNDIVGLFEMSDISKEHEIGTDPEFYSVMEGFKSYTCLIKELSNFVDILKNLLKFLENFEKDIKLIFIGEIEKMMSESLEVKNN